MRPIAVVPAAAAVVLSVAALQPACAADLGLYVGGSVGQSRVEADASGVTAGSFEQNHSAFKVMAGVRPIAVLGAEVAYIDFGHPSGGLGGQPADVKISGDAAFATLFLPIPVVDVYGKLGMARLDSTVNSTQVLVGGALRPFQLNRTETRLAAGAGVQFKLGAWAVRAEYERFDAAGGTPSLLSLGLTWTFL